MVTEFYEYEICVDNARLRANVSAVSAATYIKSYMIMITRDLSFRDYCQTWTTNNSVGKLLTRRLTTSELNEMKKDLEERVGIPIIIREIGRSPKGY